MRPGQRKKSGIVILLDALGASDFSEKQIRNFLSAKINLNKMLGELANSTHPKSVNFCGPVIFTFGDTIAITVELRSKKYRLQHLFIVTWLLRRYIYRSLEHGILFRGAFSIGEYFSDVQSNTVMGPAVSDAASWYEKADWAGVSSTPYTRNVLDHDFTKKDGSISVFGYLRLYPVPLKDTRTIELYTLDWPSAFFDTGLLPKSAVSPEIYFLKLLKAIKVPLGTEMKFIHTREYWNFISKIKNDESKGTDNS